MIYKNFKNLLLPSLGVGTMRLPTLPDGTVDEEACREMFSYAMEHGVNYFDTAYGYHNGKSEEVCGKLLSAYPRESYYLTTKFPGYDLSNMNKKRYSKSSSKNAARTILTSIFSTMCTKET